MQLRTLIFMNIFLVFNPSYTMHIINKKKCLKETYRNPTIKDLLVVQKIGQQNNLPIEITTELIKHTLLVKNKDFEQQFPSINVWHDFRIPVIYHHILTPTQINIMQQLFSCKPSNFSYRDRLVMHYYLESKEDYKEFLTLPIELRRYLTKLPQSAAPYTIDHSRRNPNNNININQTIRIGTNTTETTARLIIPEEKGQHIRFDSGQ